MSPAKAGECWSGDYSVNQVSHLAATPMIDPHELWVFLGTCVSKEDVSVVFPLLQGGIAVSTKSHEERRTQCQGWLDSSKLEDGGLGHPVQMSTFLKCLAQEVNEERMEAHFTVHLPAESLPVGGGDSLSLQDSQTYYYLEWLLFLDVT